MVTSIFNFFIFNFRCNDLHYTPVSENSLKIFAGFPAHRGNADTTFWLRDEAPAKNEKKINMKTRNLLITIGAATLTAITINAGAYDIALSPRAAANQIKTVPGTTVAQAAPATGIALSPRAAANQTPTVASVANDVNPALACRKMMTGSPKAVQVCSDNPAMPGCKATVTASATP